MTIKNVNDTNEGWYCCVTTNECSNERMHCAWLEMRGEHSLEQTVNFLNDFLGLTIVQQPRSGTFRLGSKNIIALTFFVKEKGDTSYKWERYDSISDSWKAPYHKSVNITSPNLIFSRRIEVKDEGVYHCIATDENGEEAVSENATITVFGKKLLANYLCH